MWKRKVVLRGVSGFSFFPFFSDNDFCRGFAIIDDSFFHFSENPSDQERVMLIVDLWHPGISSEERTLMEEKLRESVENETPLTK